MNRAHEVSSISFSGTKLHLTVDGRAYDIDVVKYSSKLANATREQREGFVLSPSGYGLHWPSIDEDLSIDALIGVTHSGPVAKQPH